MKQLYTYIAILTLGLATFCSCSEEEMICTFAESGNDVTLKLSVQTQANKNIEVSRAAADEKLYDLHFYVFNAQGELTGYEQLVSETGDIASPGPEDVNIRTKTGSSYIYAVANINIGDTYKLSVSDNNLLNVTQETTIGMDDTKLAEIVKSSNLKRDDLLSINFIRVFSAGDNQNYSPNPIDDKFMMSGYLNNGNQVTIRKEEETVSIAEGVDIINLYRILAKNKLTITSTQYTSGPNSGKFAFTPKSYRFCNVPKGGILVPNTNISTANTINADYFTTNTGKYHMTADNSVESSYQLSTTNNEISFYYPENLQSSEITIDYWEEREANSYDTGSKVFTNAPKNAAYIEIQGDYVDALGNLSANVSYTIHLGNFGDIDNGGSFSNFNVIRNNNYTYKVTVNGVDDIIAEAELENNNPYAEGLVINATNGKHYDVDAHYESRIMTFKKSSIEALRTFGKGYILNIKTPFGHTFQTVNVKNDGVYPLVGNKLCDFNNLSKIFEGEDDYSWIRFVRNTTDNEMPSIDEANINKYPCMYPGDSRKKYIYDSSGNKTIQYAGGWMNVFELLAELYDYSTYTNNNNTEAYYTCFIDENYYYNKSWQQYVNKDPRTMLIANDLSISADGKSLYAEVEYSISQRSIWTFYTNENIRAFGTEIIDEEDKYHNKRATDLSTDNIGTRLGDDGNYQYEYYYEKPISDKDDWNGWTSGFNTNENETWYDDEQGTVTINRRDQKYNITIKKEGIQPLYRSAAKACMSRNRDLDGSGTVEQNEVRWYLAAIDQYRALYYAQGVMHPDAHFINNDELAAINTRYVNGGWGGDYNGHNYRGYYHYWTCSDEDVSGTFWPEEGLTNNPVEASWGVSRGEMVRCIRTLESATFNEDNELTAEKYGLDNPELFYSYTSATKTFELSGIKVNRQPTTTSLGFHNETDDLNDFSTSFVVASNDLNNGSTYSSSSVTTGSDRCLTYSEGAYGNGMWRTPNQKEMALMLSVGLISKSYDYGTRTQFTGHTIYSWHTSPGFISDNGSLNLTSTNVRLRCVRDK